MKKSEAARLFDPESFRHVGHELIDALSEYLATSFEGRGAVLSGLEANALPPTLAGAITHDGKGIAWLHEQLQDFLSQSTLRVHHPRNVGHQVAPPLPLAALLDLVAATTNQAMAIYEAGPAATMIEKQVIQWMAGMLGWQHGDGVLTSGGSQANLTALLVARQHAIDRDVWSEGVANSPTLRILASEYAHYSVSRSAGIMGLGTNAVLKVPVDSDGKMCLDALVSMVADSKDKGETPFAVVATAGCTPTGSIDPLRSIGEFCRLHDLWLHVDGAHGASGLLSGLHKQSLDGIEMADSLVWDGHKLLYMPATVSAVLFRQGDHSYSAFSQQATYLFQGEDRETEAYNLGNRTLECTKRMMGFKLWASLAVYGTNTFAELLERVYQTATGFAEQVASANDFELLMRPQTNIVCFRLRNTKSMSLAQSNARVSALRNRIVRGGEFYLTQADIHGETWLRVAIMNPMTMIDDLRALLQAVRTAAAA